MKGIAVAVRSLRKSPLFLFVAVISLAIAMAAIATVAALADAALFRPIAGIAAPDQLVSIYHIAVKDPKSFSPLSWPDYEFYRDHAHSFSGLLAYLRLTVQARTDVGVEKIPAELVSENYFRVLGVRPVEGRDFGRPETGPVALISERLWREQFGRDPRISGRALAIAGHAFTIVGVVPAAFRGIVLDWGERPAIWIPLRFFREAVPELGRYDLLHAWRMQSMLVTGRLREGVGFPAAAAEIAALGQRIDTDNPARAREWKGEWMARAMPLGNARFWPGAREQIVRVIVVLLAVALAVLLISCFNVASLLLTRAAERQREVAVRLALGAGTGSVARLLLAESLVLSVSASVVGAAMAAAVVRGLAAFPRLFAIPLALDLRLDARVLAFTAAVGAAVTIGVGLAPLRQTLRTDLTGWLRTAGVAARGDTGFWSVRSMLAGAQVALALMLLVEAGLFVRTFRNAAAADPFLGRGSLLICQVDVAEGNERNVARDLPAALLQVPGIDSAALASVLPMSGFREAGDITVDGRKANVEMNSVSPGFFGLSGAAVIEGRDFDDGDTEGRAPAAIVNERMARSFWRGEAVGRQLNLRSGPVTVVGVVRDYSRRSFRSGVPPRVYFPAAQRAAGDISLVVRVHGSGMALLPQVEAAVKRLDAGGGISGPQTIETYTSEVLGQQRLTAWCLSVLSMVALVLSAVGLYGTIAYSVSQRTREIGVRMALGGTPRRIMREVLVPVAVVHGSGLIVGSLLCAAAARFTASLLYGVATADPENWALAAATLLGTALLAAAIPGLRASQIDPASALRAE